MMEHSVSTLGDKTADHWAIHAHVTAVHAEKDAPDIYSSKNIGKLEEHLVARAMPRECDIKPPAKTYEGKKVPSIHDCSGSVGGDNPSTKDSASIESDSRGVSLTGQDDAAGFSRQTEGCATVQGFISRYTLLQKEDSIFLMCGQKGHKESKL